MQVPFPIGPRAEWSASLIAAVVDQWRLDTVAHVRDIGGTYNLNLHVQTARGAYVVRVHRPWITTERLALIHAIKRALADRHLPVALPLQTANGTPMSEYDGRLVEMEPFVAHNGPANTWSRCEIGLAMLGRLHRALKPWTEQLRQTPPLVSNYGTVDQLLAWTTDTREQIAAATPTAQDALAVCDDALALLGHLMHAWSGVPALPHMPTHGDYGGDNLLFQGDRIVAIGDWDFVGVRERVFDLAYSWYWMFRRVQPDVLPDQWDWQKVPAMLAAYNAASVQPLVGEELRAFPLAMARVPLYWIAEVGWLADPAQAVLQWAEQVSVARWLMDHVDVVRQYIGNTR